MSTPFVGQHSRSANHHPPPPQQQQQQLPTISKYLSPIIPLQQPKLPYVHMPICGVDVSLPAGLRPYPTQKLMMSKILTSLKNRLNALVESPTGSGKTLALLASTLAWLANYKSERTAMRLTCPVHGENTKRNSGVLSSSENSTVADDIESPPVIDIFDDDDDDFVQRIEVKRNNKKATKRTQQTFDKSTKKTRQSCEDADFDVPPAVEEKTKNCICLPRIRIYYGTRTHKQISQIIREFERLPYAGHIRHTIMASREQSCANPQARSAPDITSHCKELIGHNGIGCAYKNALRRYETPYRLRALVEMNGPTIWDMEDLVKSLTSIKDPICPYFASNRVLNNDADIIFCPFTYMLDPVIRRNSDVHLDNAIVILDEAHNVEDACRDAASFSFTEHELCQAMDDFKDHAKTIEKSEKMSDEVQSIFDEYLRNYYELIRFTTDLLMWIKFVAKHHFHKDTTSKSSSNYDRSTSSATISWQDLEASLKSFSGEESSLLFDNKSDRYIKLNAAITGFTIRKDDENASGPHEDYQNLHAPHQSSLAPIDRFLHFLNFYTMDDQSDRGKKPGAVQYRTTYRMVLSMGNSDLYDNPSTSRNSGYRSLGTFNSPMPSTTIGTWLSADKASTIVSDYEPISGNSCSVTVNLWCMCPAVAFINAFRDSKSIILASGTLCPSETFESELGVDFKTVVVGKQVIPDEQIFATCIPAGPNGHRLCATYKNTSGTDSPFLSELTSVIMSICERVPYGVLCFLPSYRLLDDLYAYMSSSGNLAQLLTIKAVICEPRRSSDMNEKYREYREAIERVTTSNTSKRTGALMLAVYRGKVSEGIDFTDNNARCVIAVGIPYPNFMDQQVKEKRSYNDEMCRTSKMVSGSVWYTTQAYRALNQALGRCLRHRNDWGALVLVDERFERAGGDRKNISSWIGERMRPFKNFRTFERDLGNFVKKMSQS